ASCACVDRGAPDAFAAAKAAKPSATAPTADRDAYLHILESSLRLGRAHGAALDEAEATRSRAGGAQEASACPPFDVQDFVTIRTKTPAAPEIPPGLRSRTLVDG